MIDRAKPSDIPRILALLTQVNMVHHRGRPDLFKGPTTKYAPDELAALLADETRPVYVYRDADGEVLGYAFCQLSETRDDRLMQDMKTLYIDDLCVDEAARGHGIGTQLYRHVLQEASRRQCYHVTLNVWCLNAPAMKFYEACGLKPQKVVMETILNEEPTCVDCQ